MAKTLVVIGGGAAGIFCAVNAARLNPSLRVTVLEKTGRLLSKVRISGGGRCNVTHGLFEIPELSRRYPRGQNFVKKSFHQFSTSDTIAWFEARGIPLKTESDGRIFPQSDSSESIIACLLSEAALHSVEIRMNADVRKIYQNNSFHHLELADTRIVVADYVCIACGGYPKTAMFDWLKSTGHHISEPVPSLFTFNLPKHPVTALMGVSVEKARVKIEGSKLVESGPVLITHWGLSGPAVLRLSAWGARELFEKEYRFKVHINWLDDGSPSDLSPLLLDARRNFSLKKVVNHNFTKLPQRLFSFLIKESGIVDEQRLADLSSKQENLLLRNLTDYVLEVSGKTTFKEEFVTSGGISLADVDPNTMMSKKCPNLFFAGEILDVDGITGGFNFQHAWTSGWIAANSIAKLSRY